MKRLILMIMFLAPMLTRAQELSLDQCREQARNRYPLVRQQGLIESLREFTIANVHSARYPQVMLAAQATYQSDVTRVPIDVPQFPIKPLAKDQYKVYADVSQSVYDGGTVERSSQVQQLNAAVEQQKIEVELYKLRERIDQIYFGILLLDRQADQVKLLQKDLDASLRKMKAAVENGTAMRMQADVLQAESLKTRQRTIELSAMRKAYLESMALLTGMDIAEGTTLRTPETKVLFTEDITRPEMKLFNDQRALALGQFDLSMTRNRPRAGLFLQAGYGRPGLNMLVNEFSTYYLGGLRLNWNLSGYWNVRRDREISTIQTRMIDVQQDLFTLNTRIGQRQYMNEITRLQDLIAIDDELVAIRARVRQSAQAQLDNGVLSANDFIRELNAEDQARQSLLMHQIQLSLARLNYQSTTGN